MKNNKFCFIIWTPPFDEKSGGILALHRLCSLLNELGEEAYVYISQPKPNLNKNNSLTVKVINLLRLVKYYTLKYFYKTFPYLGINSTLKTPIAKRNFESNNKKIVAIYPEIVSGNPLKSENVVRWLLYRPGFQTGEINYGKDDIYFFYQVIFNDPTLNSHDDHLLTVLWLRDDLYKQTNFATRKGSCYMIRKGKNKLIVHDVKDSILLDGKSHEETAKAMNQCEYFISYDMETMYSQYAVLCGCKSIVVPNKDTSKEEWQPNEELRYGVAYGFDDLEWVEQTKHLVYDVLKKYEDNSNQSVAKFIKKVYSLL